MKYDVPFHSHYCTECQQSEKHWARDGCNLPEEIVCITCKDKQEEDGILGADNGDSIEDHAGRDTEVR
jgi:hypothetical protein